MTGDFIDDLAEACEREDVPYLIFVQNKDGSCRVCSGLKGFQGLPGVGVRESVVRAIDTALSPDYK